MKRMEVWSKCQLSESILFHCTKRNFMDMQKPGPRGRSSSINPGPGAAVECKTPGVARGSPGGGMLVLGIDWCINWFEICSMFIPLKLVHLFRWIVLLIVKVNKFLKFLRCFCAFGFVSSPMTISFSSNISGEMAVKNVWKWLKSLLVTMQDTKFMVLF